MADSRQEDIAAWFIWLWLDRKFNLVTLVDDILTKDVEALFVAL